MDLSKANSMLRSDSESVVGWDCARELRNMRDTAARVRAEEASLLRRNAEELERFALRRQTDESMALQSFLASFHDAVEIRLERLRVQLITRLESWEQRLSSDAEKCRGEALAEARRAAEEAAERLEERVATAVAAAVAVVADSVASEVAPGAGVGDGVAAVVRSGGAHGGGDGNATSLMSASSTLGVALRALSREAVQAGAEALEASAAAHDRAQRELVEEFAEDAERRGARLRALLLEEVSSQVAEVARRDETALQSLEHRVVRDAQGFREAAEAVAGETAASISRLSECVAEIEASATEALAATASASAAAAAVERELAEHEACCEAAISEERQQIFGVTESGHVQQLEGLEAAHRAACDEMRDEIAEVDLFAREEAASATAALLCAEHRLEAALRASVGTIEAVAAEDLQSLRADVHAQVEAAERRMGEAFARSNARAEGCISAGADAMSALRAELGALDSAVGPAISGVAASVQELRELLLSELRDEASASALRAQASSAESARVLERFAEELHGFKRQGLSHEWRIPMCRQRLQYSGLDAEPGLWLDSPEFALGALGRLVLRLYPSGVKHGDGQCALALVAAADVGAGGCAAEGLRSLPLVVELAVAGLRRRAALVRPDGVDGGGVFFLATGFGPMAGLAGDGDDVVVGVEVPARPWLEPESFAATAGQSSSAAAQPEPPLGATRSRPSSAGRLDRKPPPVSTGAFAGVAGSFGGVVPSTTGAIPPRPGWAMFGDPARPEQRPGSASILQAPRSDDFGSNSSRQGDAVGGAAAPGSSRRPAERRSKNPFDD